MAKLRADQKTALAERDHERGEGVSPKAYYLDLMVAGQNNSEAARGELLSKIGELQKRLASVA
eukprot:13270454-Alexandrium_andersonii.AAC.1